MSFYLINLRCAIINREETINLRSIDFEFEDWNCGATERREINAF